MLNDSMSRPVANQIKAMLKEEVPVQKISKLLNVTVACIERNMAVWNKPFEQKLKDQKNKERAIKAAKTRALKKQTAELAEKAAEALAEEEAITD